MPAETQREIADERRADREARWARLGYLYPSYPSEPQRPIRYKAPAAVISVFDEVLAAVVANSRNSRRRAA